MFVVILLLLISTCRGQVQVSVDEKGGYNITINGQVWLRSSHTSIYVDDRWYSSDTTSLPLKNITYAEGYDPNLGNWNETQLNYDLVRSGIHTKVVGSIRQWNSISAITFHLNTGDQILTNTAALDTNRVRTVFPGFNVEQMNVNDQRGFFEFSGRIFIDFFCFL